MYQLPAFEGATCQRGSGIGGIFKQLTRTFVLAVKKGLSNQGNYEGLPELSSSIR